MGKIISKKEFIRLSININGDNYDYTNIEYINTKTKIKILCNKHDISFWQIPRSHLKGMSGCKQCATEARKATCLTKYGVENPKQLDEFKRKAVVTNLKKYGVEHAAQSIVYKEQYKSQMQEKYGVGNAFQAEEIKTKIKLGNLNKYGVENVFQAESVRAKHREGLKCKYGVENPSQVEAVKEKKRQSALKRYGVENVNQRHMSKESLTLLRNKKWLENQHHHNKNTLRQISDTLGVSPGTVGRYCRRFNIEIRIYDSSEAEREVLSYIRSILPNAEVMTNSRKIIPPLELDIFIPVANLAIEYNGLFWHSSACNKSRKYHFDKTNACEDIGVQLIHIFEDEWREQKQKCKDTLRYLMGTAPKGVSSNTTVKEIPWECAKMFLDKHHLLGAGPEGNYKIGAFDEDGMIIGVMVFGCIDEVRDETTELKRWATNMKNNARLVNKMFEHAVKKMGYIKIITFVDRRWGCGTDEKSVGFKPVTRIAPVLWWTDSINRYCSVNKPSQTINGCGVDENRSTNAIQPPRKFYEMWDSGVIKLMWKSESNK